MLETGGGQVVYLVVVVDVDGIRFRALLDTGGGSSYASAALISKLSTKAFRCLLIHVRISHFGVTIRV